MDKRPIGYVAGKGTVLDKKVPKTNKYGHVESKLAGKTGTTIKDVEIMSKFYMIKLRQQRGVQEKGRTFQEDQTQHPMENAQPRSQDRVYLQY